MLTLITGGSKCGKSSIAESCFNDFEGEKYYIATMQPYGEEAHAAIERHRKARDGKCFITIEKYTDISEIQLSRHSAVLLECMGNLCANEMFAGDVLCNPVEKITEGVKHLSRQADLLVIVTNEVSCDGIEYSKETMQYIENLSRINSIIAGLADNVIECVYGIPVVMKGELEIK